MNERLLEDWCSTKKFKDQNISKDVLEKIFDLTTNAPTAFNLQPYRFIVLDSEEAKKKAIESAINANKWIQYADYKKRDEVFMTGWLTRNTIIPATFCMLACKAKGTGTFPVRGFEQRKIKKKVGFKG